MKGRSVTAQLRAMNALGAGEDPLDRLEEELEHYTERLEARNRLATAPRRSRQQVEVEAAALGVHPATVYRDLAATAGKATLRDIAPKKAGFPAGQSRLHPRQDEIIDHWLWTYYLQPAQPSLSETSRKIGDQCEDEGFSRPTRAAVIRRRDQISEVERLARREGRKVAEKRIPKPGRLHVLVPLEMYQIDHTLVDVIVISSETAAPIGRPWLTVVIDVCTRMVVGFTIGLDAPSIVRAGEAMALAISPKAAWLQAHGLEHRWLPSGLPKCAHADNGSDFRAKAFRRALMNEGVKVVYRPKRKAHWGGHVERLIGTLMGACRILPGRTMRSPEVRGEYDSKASARLSLDDLQAWAAEQIIGKYNNSPHSALGGRSPNQVWTELSPPSDPILPTDFAQFRIDLLPDEPRTIQPQGIRWQDEDYYSEAVGALLLQGKRAVLIKYDPRDRSEIYVRGLDGRYAPVPLRFTPQAPLPPLWLKKAAKKTLPVASKGDPAAVRRATANAAQIVATASGRSIREGRQRERLYQQQLRAGERREQRGSERLLEDDDDSWGGAFDE